MHYLIDLVNILENILFGCELREGFEERMSPGSRGIATRGVTRMSSDNTDFAWVEGGRKNNVEFAPSPTRPK